MIREPGSPLSELGGMPSPLTTGERARVEELGELSRFLREVAASEDAVDPDYLRAKAVVLDFRAETIVENARRLMRKGPAQVVDGTTVCLRVVGHLDPRPMGAREVEGPCRALEGAAVDVVRAINDLRGKQAFRYSDGLAMLADQLLSCARYMREMSEGMEDGDE